jgi:hypothetical protein
MPATTSNNSRVTMPQETRPKGNESVNQARRTTTFISAMMLAAASVAGYAGFVSHDLHPYLALAVLALAAATSRMKAKLPGLNSNMSVNLPFLLTAVASLSGAEAVVIAFVSTAVQCWPRKAAKFNPLQVAFNLSMISLATGLATLMYHVPWSHRPGWSSTPVGLALAAATLFLGQTAPVAAVIALSEGKAVGALWWGLAHLSFPYFVVSAGVSSMVQMVGSHLGWELALGVFPVMYGIHRSYSLYFGKMALETDAPRAAVMVRAASAGA